MKEQYEQNAALIRSAQQGDEEAMDRLIQANLGLVKSIAARFRDRGTEYEDLVQIGSIGMIKAVKSFDFGYGTVFSTYAVPLIIGEIRRHLRDDGMIKVGRSLRKSGSEVMRQHRLLCDRLGREPRIGELAEACGMTSEQAAYALEAVSPVRSLSEPRGEEGVTLESLLADGEDRIERLTDHIALRQALATLPEQQRQIVHLRYFRGLSQQQTGSILGLTQVKVSREEKKIMAALRALL